MPKLPTLPALSISPEKAYFIAAEARQFDAKDGLTDPQSGSNASDDRMRSILEDRTEDPVLAELTSFIHDLNDDEQIVRDHLPLHAQDIYRAAFNHAFAAHDGDVRQEEIAHRTAWTAVKRSYVNDGDRWVPIG
jgi:cation transport regulator